MNTGFFKPLEDPPRYGKYSFNANPYDYNDIHVEPLDPIQFKHTSAYKNAAGSDKELPWWED
jgi:hypothetical protein